MNVNISTPRKRKLTNKPVAKSSRRRLFGPTQNRIGPLPKSQRTKFIYADRIVVTSPASAGLCGNYVIGANGLFDPDLTGTGHQPRGFDQLIGQLYTKYCVVKATIEIWWPNNASAALINGVVVDRGTTVTNNLEDYTENGTAIIKYNHTDSPVYMKKVVDVAKFLGKKDIVDDPDCHGTVGTSPTDLVTFQLFTARQDAASASGSSQLVQIRVCYEAILLEGRVPTIS